MSPLGGGKSDILYQKKREQEKESERAQDHCWVEFKKFSFDIPGCSLLLELIETVKKKKPAL